VRYLSQRRRLLGCGYEQGKGRVDLLDLAQGKSTCKLTVGFKIYNMQLSQCEKMVFLNLSSMEIRAYTTSKFELRYKFTGYVQRKCLMRMAVGGRRGELLAVSSEEGCVCVYNLKKQEMVGEIRNVSGKPVNCVRWVGDGLYFGCDDGYVEHWVVFGLYSQLIPALV
jgi:WD40 repeat protein